MKSLQKLFEENYPFATAKKDLIKLIEQSFSDQKECIEIPQFILKSFSLNLNESKIFFKELEELGYCLKFKNQNIIINFVNETHENLVKSISQQNFDRFLDEKNFIDYIIELINKVPKEWKKPNVNFHGPQRSGYTYTYRDEHGDSFDVGIFLDKNYIRFNDFKIFINSKQVYLLEQALAKKDLIMSNDLVCLKKFGRKKETIIAEDLLIQSLKKAIGEAN